MRIRKRPATQTQIAADPSPRAPPSNGGDEPKDRGERGRGTLHPDGDLPYGHPTVSIQSHPSAGTHLNGCCIIPSLNHTHLQPVIKEKEKQEEEIDSNKPPNAEVLMSSYEGMKRGVLNVNDEKHNSTAATTTTAPNNNKNPNVGIEGHESSKKPTEGSRCSRVNGRGWRCSQQTLVGYSLCEHHLGKARLRSISTVRSNQSTALGSTKGNNKLKSEHDVAVKRVKKMVKARSINSLLNESNNMFK